MPKHILTSNEINHLATLANLTLTSEEIEKYSNQIGETIEYVENLKELDTTNVEATNNGIRTENVFFEDGEKCERMLTQKEAVSNAKVTKDEVYFIVDRIHHDK